VKYSNTVKPTAVRHTLELDLHPISWPCSVNVSTFIRQAGRNNTERKFLKTQTNTHTI